MQTQPEATPPAPPLDMRATRPADCLPVDPALAPLLPWPGLRRGTSISVAGSASLLLALIARASQESSWCAVLGMPQLGLEAATHAGVDISRLALLPDPGRDAATMAAALIDGLDFVVLGPNLDLAPSVARRLMARARRQDAVLLSTTELPGADLCLDAGASEWHGIGSGRGRLRQRRVEVVASGRAHAGRSRAATLLLPTAAGPVRASARPPAAGVVARPVATGTDAVRATASAASPQFDRGREHLEVQHPELQQVG